MKDLIFNKNIYKVYDDPMKVTSTIPSIFLIAKWIPENEISIKKGFLSSNPFDVLSFDSGYPLLRENEVILLLQHEFTTKKQLFPTLLALMEYHYMDYYDLDTNKPIEFGEIKEKVNKNN